MTPDLLRSRHTHRAWAVVAAAVLGPLAGGCCSCGSPCADDIQGQFPQPNGTFVREYMFRQSAKAEQEDFVIYQYEWLFEEPDKLGPFGTSHVQAVARRMQGEPNPVVIQIDDDPQLNELRKSVVVNALLEMGVVDAAQRVYVGAPQAEGLYGDEAERAYNLLISGSGAGQGQGGHGGMGGLGGGLGGFGGGMGGGLGGFGGGLGGFGGGFK
jgi:hypothetical protein